MRTRSTRIAADVPGTYEAPTLPAGRPCAVSSAVRPGASAMTRAAPPSSETSAARALAGPSTSFAPAAARTMNPTENPVAFGFVPMPSALALGEYWSWRARGARASRTSASDRRRRRRMTSSGERGVSCENALPVSLLSFAGEAWRGVAL